MEGINAGNIIRNSANQVASQNNVAPSGGIPPTSNAVDSSQTVQADLTGISLISAQVKQSSPELRQDMIDRAKALVNDPNWLNDSNLDLLADKIGAVEKI
ncbi:MAG: hypothetical protein VW576_06485 [Opitutae bacterium]